MDEILIGRIVLQIVFYKSVQNATIFTRQIMFVLRSEIRRMKRKKSLGKNINWPQGNGANA